VTSPRSPALGRPDRPRRSTARTDTTGSASQAGARRSPLVTSSGVIDLTGDTPPPPWSPGSGSRRRRREREL
jgi:hypothetical protein